MPGQPAGLQHNPILVSETQQLPSPLSRENKAVCVQQTSPKPSWHSSEGAMAVFWRWTPSAKVQEVLTHEQAVQDTALLPACLIKDQQTKCEQQASLPRMGHPTSAPPSHGPQASVGTAPPLPCTCTLIPQHAAVQGYLFQNNNETAWTSEANTAG